MLSFSQRLLRTLLSLWLISATSICLANDFKLGMEALENGNVPLAIEYWKPLAEAGDPDAQFGMAAIYNDGIGVAQDYAEANYWLLQAAEQGYAAAQYNLGNAYRNGTGMVIDLNMAAIWWRKAAEQNFAPAQFNLGSALLEGAGVVRNQAEGTEWYRRAAANGHPHARSNLEALGESVLAEKTPAIQAAVEPTPTIAAPAPAPAPEAEAEAEAEPKTEIAAATLSAPSKPDMQKPVIAAGSQNTDCTALLTQQQHSHTLQLMASYTEAATRAYSTENALTDTAICNYEIKGVRWYALLYGRYESAGQARQALEALPDEVRSDGAYIRRIDVIRRAVSE